MLAPLGKPRLLLLTRHSRQGVYQFGVVVAVGAVVRAGEWTQAPVGDKPRQLFICQHSTHCSTPASLPDGGAQFAQLLFGYLSPGRIIAQFQNFLKVGNSFVAFARFAVGKPA